ncbi:MAG: thioredoxin [Candidatus Gastranaerophilales bacterium]|nr:thioredoxin [Candidatus Gastranaerophilales bacterium]
MSNTLEVTDATFEQDVKKSDVPVLVDFWAPWCGPCRKLSPIIDEIAEEYQGRVKIVKVNTDENTKIAQEYSISGIPSLLVFKDGEAVERMVGLLQKSAITNTVDKYL